MDCLHWCNKKTGCFFACTFIILFPLFLEASEISLYWSGMVRGPYAYPGGTVPEGIPAESLVEGQLVFETTAYTSSINISDYDFESQLYSYPVEMVNTIHVGDHTWVLNGADVGLSEKDPNPTTPGIRSFYVSSNSVNYQFEQFTGYVGSFEFLLAFEDQNEPQLLFDSIHDIDNLPLRLNSLTTVLGSLKTIVRDNDFNPVDGYYFEFEADKVSNNPDSPLEADFEVTQNYGATSLLVKYTDFSKGDVGSWLWDFGDGNTSREQNPSHLYDEPGQYFINLIVIDVDGFAKKYGVVTIAPPEVDIDINNDNKIDLTDMIMVLQILVGADLGLSAIPDINGDLRTGVEEAAYLIQEISKSIK